MTAPETVDDLGEFGLIERIETLLGPSRAVVGIGDDAAVLDVGGEEYLLATVDMLVEGVHFPVSTDPVALGRRAVAINLSDIAAMGGTPTFALVSLALPAATARSFVDGLYAGLAEEARRFGVAVVGGNISSTHGPIVVDLALLGRVPPSQVLRRRGAQPGDVLLVSGSLGRRSAQRLLFERDSSRPYPEVPEPRVGLGRALAEGGLAHAAIDLSDGLGSDIHHLAARSGVGAVVLEDQLPIASVTHGAADQVSVPPVELALFGGEDYELLIAVSPDRVEEAIDAAGTVPLHVVGNVLDQREGVTLQLPSGIRVPLPARGWTHF